MGKNILNDMTLLTVGAAPAGSHGGTTLGHIGTGYLYANFGPQIRYTTPDLAGAKLAIAIAEPYNITLDTAKTNSPRVEAEFSYAKAFGGGTTVQSWVSGLYQTAPRKDTATARPGKDDESIGGAYGLGAGFSGINLLFSGYGGRGLGMVSAQEGKSALSADAGGSTRLSWGYLAQATYRLTPSILLGLNYGQSRLEETHVDAANRAAAALIKNQEAGTGTVTYNLNKFTQFVAEYTYAQDTFHDGAKAHSNLFALGTMFYW
jgi:predicted porin